MTARRRTFKVVVWIGILLNWTFVGMALADPRHLIAALDLGATDSTVWLFNYSVLLALLSCFYIPAAADPFRYRVNAWLLIAARFVPAATFFIGVVNRVSGERVRDTRNGRLNHRQRATGAPRTADERRPVAPGARNRLGLSCWAGL